VVSGDTDPGLTLGAVDGEDVDGDVDDDVVVVGRTCWVCGVEIEPRLVVGAEVSGGSTDSSDCPNRGCQ
jgi:hypothetical protein